MRCRYLRSLLALLRDVARPRAATHVEPMPLSFGPEPIADPQRLRVEPRCPGGCHGGDMPDFDHYCDAAGIEPGEEGAAFAAWLNAIAGWDGDASPLTLCWCGRVHDAGYWHDPTHGQVDRDIQDYVAAHYADVDRSTPAGRAQVVALENTLQEKRRRGTLSW